MPGKNISSEHTLKSLNPPLFSYPKVKSNSSHDSHPTTRPTCGSLQYPLSSSFHMLGIDLQGIVQGPSRHQGHRLPTGIRVPFSPDFRSHPPCRPPKRLLSKRFGVRLWRGQVLDKTAAELGHDEEIEGTMRTISFEPGTQMLLEEEGECQRIV
jgi:hypothetical protein